MTEYTSTLTEEELIEYKEAFSLFDKEGNGIISVNSLGSVLRALGICPTQAEIRDMISEVDPKNTGGVNFQTFLKVAIRKKRKAENSEEIIEAFRVFDREGKGIITTSQLKHIMTNLGEKMTEDEADDMIREADINGTGEINYEEFVKMLAEM